MSGAHKSHSRPRASRNTTSSGSVPYLPQAESLILPNGPVGEEAVELLNEFVHPHQHTTEGTLVGAESGEDDLRDKLDENLPWWKRPSPWWLLGVIPFTAIATAATIAPRIEIYTILACSVHKPDIFRQNFPGLELGLQPIPLESPQLGFLGLSTVPMTPFNQRLGTLGPAYFSDGSLILTNITGNGGDALPPVKRNLCASDPVVQAAVAKLTATIAACMGILSCITTGWWGAFSDRHGRTRVMGISVLGLLLTDFNFIMVTLFSKHIPGGYWFLVVGPTVEGCLGGMTTGVAAMHAYLADTTNEGNRSRVLSLSLGLLFTGMAIGPTLGSLLIRFTGHTLSVFYAAGFCHLLYTFLAWFILPESVTRRQMVQAKAQHKVDSVEEAAERERNPAVGLLVKARRLFAFLSPLTLFMPREETIIGNPLKKPKKDWSLTLMALVYGFTVSVMGSYSYKFQYAASQFGWSSETLGYWLSLVSASRAVFLAAILPIGIRLFKPKPIILELSVPSTEATPLLNSTSDESEPSSSRVSFPPKIVKKEIHSPSFDFGLVRLSLLVDVIAYTFMAISPTPLSFTVFSLISSLGAGFSPAMQTVTLALYTRRGGTESGRLFGALSVIQALCSQILGPSVYGFVYVKTVATFPRAIFFITVVTIVVSFILINFVRLPDEKDYSRRRTADLEEPAGASPLSHQQETTLVNYSSEDTESIKARERRGGTSTYGTTGL